MEKNESVTTNKYIPMYLMNSAIELGRMKEFVDSIEDQEIKDMALGEYYYFSGNHE